MNRIEEFILKSIRKLYLLVFHRECKTSLVENDPDIASEMIYELLSTDRPCMIARYGSTELSCFVNYLGIRNSNPSVWKYISNKQSQWWWNKNIMLQMQRWSGFFPPTEEKLSHFCEMMLRDSKEVDLIGSWLEDEDLILKEHKTIKKVKLLCLEPYWSKKPWSRVLEGKKVLVVHPFSEEIIAQYNNHREQLFENKSVLPQFASLRVVKAVQSLGGESNGFKDWFEALEWMKQEMDKEPYDIALIGCGAYGFPLAAHAKRTGHKAVHLGGALQLLFGIKGKRWTKSNYATEWGMTPNDLYLKLFERKEWIWPSPNSKPSNANAVENGCYW
jgi:hypothetical protein